MYLKDESEDEMIRQIHLCCCCCCCLCLFNLFKLRKEIKPIENYISIEGSINTTWKETLNGKMREDKKVTTEYIFYRCYILKNNRVIHAYHWILQDIRMQDFFEDKINIVSPHSMFALIFLSYKTRR